MGITPLGEVDQRRWFTGNWVDWGGVAVGEFETRLLVNLMQLEETNTAQICLQNYCREGWIRQSRMELIKSSLKDKQSWPKYLNGDNGFIRVSNMNFEH